MNRRFFSLVSVLLLLLGRSVAAQSLTETRTSLIAIDEKGAGDGSASADGRFIAASSTRSDGQSSIWLFDRNTASWRQLTKTGNRDREPAIAPDGGFVVFISDRNGQTNLWAVEVSTGREFALTNDDLEKDYPAWSKDGKQLVFTGGPWKARNFYTLDFAASSSHPPAAPQPVLSKSAHVGACNFKPDGKLVCHVYEGNAGELVEIDPRTGRVSKLTSRSTTESWWYYKPDASPDGSIAVTVIGDEGDVIRFLPSGGKGEPAPSPSVPGSWPQFVNAGRELIYHRMISEGVGLKLLDMQNGHWRDLKVEGHLAGFAALAPNGRTIAYCRKDAERWTIRLRELDTGRDWPLPVHREACNPAWSPAGNQLAISLHEGEHWSQAIVETDGTGLRVLREGNNSDWQRSAPSAWSPDGRQIVYAAATAPYESNLFVADLTTGSVRNITNDTWYNEGPSWSADGHSIVFMSTRGGGWTWGLFAIPAIGGEAKALVPPDWIERRFPQLDGDGTVWWIESDLCLGATYLVRQPPGGKPQKYFDLPGASWISRSEGGRTAILPISRQRVEYWSLSLFPDGKIEGR